MVKIFFISSGRRFKKLFEYQNVSSKFPKYRQFSKCRYFVHLELKLLFKQCHRAIFHNFDYSKLSFCPEFSFFHVSILLNFHFSEFYDTLLLKVHQTIFEAPSMKNHDDLFVLFFTLKNGDTWKLFGGVEHTLLECFW